MELVRAPALREEQILCLFKDKVMRTLQREIKTRERNEARQPRCIVLPVRYELNLCMLCRRK
jgi:hypothetical protein